MITLTNLHIQNASSVFVPNGSISFQLNVDATVIAAPGGFVSADNPVTFQLDANGDLIQPARIYSNAELNPQLSSTLLGTYYEVQIRDQNGATLSQPMWWQFPEAANATVDISQMTPISAVGGNVIFYPTSFTPTGVFNLQPPTLTTLGGVFANPGAAGQYISSINTDGTVTLTPTPWSNVQSPNFIFAGPATGSSAFPTFRAIVAADLPAGTIYGSIANTQVAVGAGPNTIGGSTAVTFNGEQFAVVTVPPNANEFSLAVVARNPV